MCHISSKHSAAYYISNQVYMWIYSCTWIASPFKLNTTKNRFTTAGVSWNPIAMLQCPLYFLLFCWVLCFHLPNSHLLNGYSQDCPPCGIVSTSRTNFALTYYYQHFYCTSINACNFQHLILFVCGVERCGLPSNH